MRIKLDAATKDFNDGQYDKLKKELEDDAWYDIKVMLV